MRAHLSTASSAIGLLVLMLMAILTLTNVKVKADACASYANGCSIPLQLNYFYKDEFTPSCNRHDVCYRCGVAYGESRLSCDNAFLNDMRKACSKLRKRRRRSRNKRLFDLSKELCKNVALQYYLGVRSVGFIYYHDSPMSYCNDPAIPSCLP